MRIMSKKKFQTTKLIQKNTHPNKYFGVVVAVVVYLKDILLKIKKYMMLFVHAQL